MNFLVSELWAGKNIAIHCHAGIGRSSLLAACVMVSEGLTASDAFDHISIARGVQVPETELQRLWVKRLPGSHPEPAGPLFVADCGIAR